MKNLKDIWLLPLQSDLYPLTYFSNLLVDRSQQIHRVQRAFGRLFMLEVSENIAAGGELLLQAPDHRLTFFGSIGRLAIAIVRVVGGDYVGSIALFCFGYTERDVPLAQRAPSVVPKIGKGTV